MIIILGLIVLIAALAVGMAGVLGNGGSAHSVTHFSVLGYHLTGSAGTLFLAGIVVGVVGLLGLSLLLAGARRTFRRRSAARRALQQSRRETATASRERDDLIDQRDSARTHTASHLSNGTRPDAQVAPIGDRWSRFRDLRSRLAPAPASERPEPAASQPAAEVPASASDARVTAVSPASDVPAAGPGPDAADISPARDAHATALAE